MPTRTSTHKSSKRALARVLATGRTAEFFLTTDLGDENVLVVAPPGKKVKSLVSGQAPDIKNAKKMSSGTVRVSGKKLVFQIGPVSGVRPAIKTPGGVKKVLKALKSEPGLSFLGKAEVTQDEVDEVTITDRETGEQLIGEGELISEGEALTQEEMLSLLVDDDMPLDDAQKLIDDCYSLSKGLDELDMMALDTFKPGGLLKMESRDLQEKARHQEEARAGREVLSETRLANESEILDALTHYKKLRSSEEGRRVLEDLGISESQLRFLKNNMPSDPGSLSRLKRRLLKNFGTDRFDVEIENADQKKDTFRLLKGTSRPELSKGRYGVEYTHSGKELKDIPRGEVDHLIIGSRYSKHPIPEEVRQFEAHLITEFSHENIEFLDACHRTLTADRELTRQDYQDLADRFINTGSDKEINIAYQERQAILDALSGKKSLSEIAKAFSVGVKSIRGLLNDSKSRFVKLSREKRRKIARDRAVLEERWYKGQETWLKLSSTASPETRRRVRATVTPYDPDNPGSFEPTMSRGEANAIIVEWNIDSMG